MSAARHDARPAADPRDRGGPGSRCCRCATWSSTFAARAGLLGRPGAGARGGRRDFDVQKARRSASSASSAAASPPPRGCCMRPHPARSRASCFSTASRSAPERARSRDIPPAGADGVPGQLRLAQPAPHHRGHRSPSARACTALRAEARGARAHDLLRQGRARAAAASPAAIRTNCPAGSASASTSPARSRSSRGW